MLDVLLARLQQGHRTHPFPDALPTLPDRFRGLPAIDVAKCPVGCRDCADACPTGAITLRPAAGAPDVIELDLGRCLFCTDCVQACPEGAIAYTQDFRLATRTRADLRIGGARALELARSLDARARSLFGRSLHLRVVSAGGCNACEADVSVLTTLVFDLGRFGIRFVASPRHADGLLVTGPVTKSMELALRKTYDAIPPPKLVIAVGACAISGGPYVGHDEALDGADAVLPVDLYVPGCPPHPFTILDGLLRLLGRLAEPTRNA